MERLERILERLENASANQDSAQLIGAVSSVLNAETNRDKTGELLETSIKVNSMFVLLHPKQSI